MFLRLSDGSKSGLILSEHPNPTTKIGSKMGGEFTYPKLVPLVLTHNQIEPSDGQASKSRSQPRSAQRAPAGVVQF